MTELGHAYRLYSKGKRDGGEVWEKFMLEAKGSGPPVVGFWEDIAKPSPGEEDADALRRLPS